MKNFLNCDAIDWQKTKWHDNATVKKRNSREKLDYLSEKQLNGPFVASVIKIHVIDPDNLSLHFELTYPNFIDSMTTPNNYRRVK